jgi:hypothetical protein
MTYISPHLRLYVSDLFTAARHHPQLDGRLLTTTAHEAAESLARASRVLCMNPTGMELIHEWLSYLSTEGSDEQAGTEYSAAGKPLDEKLKSRDSLATTISEKSDVSTPSSSSRKQSLKSLLAEIATNSETIQASLATGQSKSMKSKLGPPPDMITTSDPLSELLPQPETESDNTFDVSEVDIARIVPRVITHRLRVRNGPRDEVLSSAFFGATTRTVPPPGPEGAKERISVKDVVVRILAEV